MLQTFEGFVLQTSVMPPTRTKGYRIRVRSKTIAAVLRNSGSWRTSLVPYPHEASDAHLWAAKVHAQRCLREEYEIGFEDYFYDRPLDELPDGRVFVFTRKESKE